MYLLKQRRDITFEGNGSLSLVPKVADCSTNGSSLAQKMTGMQQTLLVAHVKKDDTRVLHDVVLE